MHQSHTVLVAVLVLLAACSSARSENRLTDPLPEQFDVRFEWLGCGKFVVDQGQCGDCWAASATGTLGDRACIHLFENGQPIGNGVKGYSPGMPGGAGAIHRMFESSGQCIGAGSNALAHQHGCQRSRLFLSPQKLVSCGNDRNTAAPKIGRAAGRGRGDGGV